MRGWVWGCVYVPNRSCVWVWVAHVSVGVEVGGGTCECVSHCEWVECFSVRECSACVCAGWVVMLKDTGELLSLKAVTVTQFRRYLSALIADGVFLSKEWPSVGLKPYLASARWQVRCWLLDGSVTLFIAVLGLVSWSFRQLILVDGRTLGVLLSLIITEVKETSILWAVWSYDELRLKLYQEAVWVLKRLLETGNSQKQNE